MTLDIELVNQIAAATREARDVLKELHETIKDARKLKADLDNFMKELNVTLERKLERERKQFHKSLEEMKHDFIQMLVDQTVTHLNNAIEEGVLTERMEIELNKVLSMYPLLGKVPK